MALFRADLHIHTVLSPCGDLSMSPSAIVDAALERNLQIIAITDHNSTLQAPLIKQIGEQRGLAVWMGAEVTTREEAHCVVLMPDETNLSLLQQYLEYHLIKVENNVDKFGYQLVVDHDENIVQEYPWLLITAINQSIDEIAKFVHDRGGVFIPAHVTRPMFSLVSQLGFIPPDLPADALELSKHTTYDEFVKGHGRHNKLPIVRSSDAHYIADIGSVFTNLELETTRFEEFKLALKAIDGRRIINQT